MKLNRDLWLTNKRALLISLLVFAVFELLGVYLINRYNFIDFPVYYQAGRSLLAGRTDLYAPDFALNELMDYRYPPFFVVVFSPLALVPYKIAAHVWYWLCFLQTAGCVFFVRRMIVESQTGRLAEVKGSWMIWTLTLLAVGAYFVMALKYGNAHLLVTFLLFGAFYFSFREKDGWAAFFISLAVTVKLLPLIALPYFALKRRWLFLCLTGLFLVLLNLAPALYFGFNKNVELLGTWYEHVVVNHEAHEKDTSIDLSLKGQMRRYLTEIDYSKKTDSNFRTVNVASIREETWNRIWVIGAVAVYGFAMLLIWFAQRRNKSQLPDAPEKARRDRLLIEYSLVTCLILFVAPLSPKTYFIQLLLPYACLASLVFARPARGADFNRWILILIAAVNLILPLLPGRNLQRLLLVIGTDFYLLCFLIIVAMRLLIAPPQTENLQTQK